MYVLVSVRTYAYLDSWSLLLSYSLPCIWASFLSAFSSPGENIRWLRLTIALFLHTHHMKSLYVSPIAQKPSYQNGHKHRYPNDVCYSDHMHLAADTGLSLAWPIQIPCFSPRAACPKHGCSLAASTWRPHAQPPVQAVSFWCTEAELRLSALLRMLAWRVFYGQKTHLDIIGCCANETIFSDIMATMTLCRKRRKAAFALQTQASSVFYFFFLIYYLTPFFQSTVNLL